MNSTSPMTPQEQYQCLNLLDCLSDLLTAANVEIFHRADLLVILNNLRCNREFFDPDVVVAQMIATAHIGIE